MESNEKPTIFPILNIIKFICLVSIFLQIRLQLSNKGNTVNINNQVKTRDLLSMINLTNYNMVRFVDYELLDFNSIILFKYFRKKYFNISNFKFEYNKKNNNTKIEYNFELYDENKNLIDAKNKTKKFKIECVIKLKKLKKDSARLIDNKYYKCSETFDISKPTKFGVQFSSKKLQFNVFFDSAELFGLNK